MAYAYGSGSNVRVDDAGVDGVPLSWLVRLCAGAVAQGVPRDQLFARSLIDLQYGDDRDRVSPAQHLLLCMNTAMAIDDAAHGFGFQRLQCSYSALSLRVMLGCSTLEAALYAVAKLYSLESSIVRVDLDTAGDVASLKIRAEAKTESGSFILEDIALSWLFVCCSHFVGRPLPLIDVMTRDRAHMNLGARHWAAKAPVRLGAVAALRFPKPVLASRRIGQADGEAHWACLRPWLQFVEGDARTPALAQVTVSALRLDRLARQAGLSPQALRRRLGGFRQVRRQALADAGVALLRAGGASVEAVAADLGYADARSFRRFLKGATGKTPNEIRATDGVPASIAGPNPAVHRHIRHIASLLDQQ
ncbi:MAG TPA: AraC family transcriptional regulator ligand-binding domain-containing protein [Vineibacter sp.]|nr:AraC family transcriptional regulator ligand-binding domain-containing protein [Vineibacter sp.]